MSPEPKKELKAYVSPESKKDRKAYVSPSLIAHGDIAEVTTAVGNMSMVGDNPVPPNTKTF